MPKDGMTKTEARARIEKLKKEINYHRYLYHVLDRQEISDAALDSLKNELQRLEEQYPEFITPDSPTQRIGGRALEQFKKVRHRAPMLSFTDSFTEEEFSAWVARITKIVPDAARAGFFSELKIDGLAISLVYQDGVFHVGSTRGDGMVGEDVTRNLRTVDAIPLRVRTTKEMSRDLVVQGFSNLAERAARRMPKEIEVRGEVFLGKKEFIAVNREQKQKGLPLYANPRNIAAGSVRQLDPMITASRKLDSFAYDLVTDLGQTTHEETHALLRALGFKTNAHNRLCRTADDASVFHKKWGRDRDGLPYEIDGIVVIVNDNTAFGRLGVAGKAPRGAIAYKFALKEAQTVVEKINVYVGRTGALTPVVRVRPVRVGGVVITNATLHNFDQLAKLDVRVRDTVIIGRAGDVIPQVTKVLVTMRPRNAKKFVPPKVCPVCKTLVVKEGVFVRCPNKECPALRSEHLRHFAAKSSFDIVGLGPHTIDKLLEAGLVRDIADFFALKPADLKDLEGFANISAQKMHTAIQAKKEVPLDRFIQALGILHVGEGTALALSRHFGTLRELREVSEEELRRVPDVGAVVAGSIARWFKDPANKKLLEKLERVGVRPIGVRTKKKSQQTLLGKTIVFTGELVRITRDEAKALAREHGADVSGSVSKKTSFVVVGEDPGLKYERAKKLGVATVDEEGFFRAIRKN